MGKKISYGFLLGLTLWAGIILMRGNGICIPFINDHFTDFITVPMYCYLIQYIMNVVLGSLEAGSEICADFRALSVFFV